LSFRWAQNSIGDLPAISLSTNPFCHPYSYELSLISQFYQQADFLFFIVFYRGEFLNGLQEP